MLVKFEQNRMGQTARNFEVFFFFFFFWQNTEFLKNIFDKLLTPFLEKKMALTVIWRYI